MMHTVAAVQMISSPSVADNLATARRLVAQAAAAGAQLVVLPEYWAIMGQQETDKLAHAEQPGSGPIQDGMAQMARQHGIWLIGGTLPLISGEEGKVLLKVRVLPDGNPASVDVEKSSSFGRLDEAARQAVARWRFVPAKRGDEPI